LARPRAENPRLLRLLEMTPQQTDVQPNHARAVCAADRSGAGCDPQAPVGVAQVLVGNPISVEMRKRERPGAGDATTWPYIKGADGAPLLIGPEAPAVTRLSTGVSVGSLTVSGQAGSDALGHRQECRREVSDQVVRPVEAEVGEQARPVGDPAL
jgi:hypothetical protein